MNNYNEINSLTFRRVAIPVDAPALTWHRAFWIRDIYEGDEGKDDITEVYVRYNLDKAIHGYINLLLSKGIIPTLTPRTRTNDAYILFNTAIDKRSWLEAPLDDSCQKLLEGPGRTVKIMFTIDTIVFHICIELHLEYFCITTIANFSDDVTNYSNIFDLKSTYKGLVDVFSNRCLPEQAKAICKNAHEYLHSRFWQHFLSIEERNMLFGSRIFTNPFADFRGFIFSNETWKASMAGMLDFNNSTWMYKIDKKLQLLLEGTNLHETTASGILSGRGIYMSTLGAERTESRTSPIEYVVFVQKGRSCDDTIIGKLTGIHEEAFVRGVNAFELGRFIDRLHLMGTMRLAALRYYSDLLKVNAALSFFDPHVQHARDAVAAKDTSLMDWCITQAHKSFQQITTDFNEGTKTRSGIMYRIEKARYYIDQFRTNIDDLELSTLRGYQRYDRFVERQLGPAFDFIDRLGRRYVRAMESLTSLDQYNVSVKTNETNVKTNETNESIENMQFYAELALKALLIPYYCLGVLTHFVSETWMPYVSWLFWGFCLYWAANSYLKETSAKNPIKALISFLMPVKAISLGPVLALILVTILFQLFNKLHLPMQDQEAVLEEQNRLIKNQSEGQEKIRAIDEQLLAHIRDIEGKARFFSSSYLEDLQKSASSFTENSQVAGAKAHSNQSGQKK